MTRPGTKVNKAKHDRGVCIGCGRKLSIHRDGTIFSHSGNRLQRTEWDSFVCSGAGKLPEVCP